MAKKALIIVESPSKAKTIQKYLGRDFIVKASVGHIKDLPKNKLGVDPKNGFRAEYQVLPNKVKVIEELRKAAQLVPQLYLATDPDREGEAIAWHIQEELQTRGKKIHRVLFNAITKPHILKAIENPLALNSDKYHAQQARRILDRLVGYTISPLLWDKVKRGLSAGRVQSVALRLIVERETEIKQFKPKEYWNVEGIFSKNQQNFKSKLFKINGENPDLQQVEQVNTLLDSLASQDWRVDSLEQKERSRKPSPPLITSKLQQEAAHKLGFSAKKTMMIAQQLYEGIDLKQLGTHGLITYMRTDSVRIDPPMIESARQYIKTEYGGDYLPTTPHSYQSKKSAQDAHEAIRPTSLDFPPETIQHLLESDAYRLYQLIWNRFLASQMTPALYHQTVLHIINTPQKNNYLFRTTGSVLKFPGFTILDQETKSTDETSTDEDSTPLLQFPLLQPGESVQQISWLPTQHFTQAPPRYTDASLIKELEEKGIGRPSTYAAILSNLQDREYVEKRENRYYPSELGSVVAELLIASFPEILNTEFTAAMETQLDAIEEGNANWKKILSDFWQPFEKTLDYAKKQMKDLKRQEIQTDILCDACQRHMVIRWGKLGSFLACSNYPDCKNTQDFTKNNEGTIIKLEKEYTDQACKKCGQFMVIKNGKFGKFLACKDYPTCKSTAPFTIGIPCPVCKNGQIAERQSRFKRIFYSCNQWPECNFALWNQPIPKACPSCHFPLLIEKITKKSGKTHECSQKDCHYIESIPTP